MMNCPKCNQWMQEDNGIRCLVCRNSICAFRIPYEDIAAFSRASEILMIDQRPQRRLKPDEILIIIDDKEAAKDHSRIEFDVAKSTLQALEKIPDSQLTTVLQPIYEYLYKRGCRINR